MSQKLPFVLELIVPIVSKYYGLQYPFVFCSCKGKHLGTNMTVVLMGVKHAAVVTQMLNYGNDYPFSAKRMTS